MTEPTGAARLEHAIRMPRKGRIAVAPYMVAGFPSRDGFVELLRAFGDGSDAILLAVPFTDPMADGLTLEPPMRVALEQGVHLKWVLSSLHVAAPAAPVILVSYLNPLMAYGLRKLVRDAAEVAVAGLLVPDLPYEECGDLRDLCDSAGMALVQTVTPHTSPERLRKLMPASRGFILAVTGPSARDGREVKTFLEGVTRDADLPVVSGLPVRSRQDVAGLVGYAHGAIVSDSLAEILGRGGDGVAYIEGLVPDDLGDDLTDMATG